MAEPLSYDVVASVLRHDQDGTLTWLVSRGVVRAGSTVKRLSVHGYLTVAIFGRTFLAHRVVWLLEHGEWPATQLDHRDGVKTNNAPSNLRLCTNAQNQCNIKPRGKFKGVCFHKQTGKFQAACGKTYLGLFATQEEAARAYDAVASVRFGEFAWLNFPGATP